MGTKFKVWLDSGANIHSCREITIDLEDCFAMTYDEFMELDEDSRDDLMRDVAFERADWGYCLAEED
jgi:hypothetical protein